MLYFFNGEDVGFQQNNVVVYWETAPALIEYNLGSCPCQGREDEDRLIIAQNRMGTRSSNISEGCVYGTQNALNKTSTASYWLNLTYKDTGGKFKYYLKDLKTDSFCKNQDNYAVLRGASGQITRVIPFNKLRDCYLFVPANIFTATVCSKDVEMIMIPGIPGQSVQYKIGNQVNTNNTGMTWIRFRVCGSLDCCDLSGVVITYNGAINNNPLNNSSSVNSFINLENNVPISIPKSDILYFIVTQENISDNIQNVVQDPNEPNNIQIQSTNTFFQFVKDFAISSGANPLLINKKEFPLKSNAIVIPNCLCKQ
jgi:hypothetical protein